MDGAIEAARPFKISVVVPVKDEQDTLVTLVDGITNALPIHHRDGTLEIIFIDDGSRDRSWQVMTGLVAARPGVVKAYRFRRNFGKAMALNTGFAKASGDIIFTMDADLQDDPKEIPRFLDAMDSGLDMVSGWKRRRNDPLSKTLPSKLFNKATAAISGVNLHDFNCGFKAYRREVLEQFKLYGEMHRYIPVLANDAGFKVGEIEVEHHARKHGVSKYGIERYVRGFLDLLAILATTRYLQRPGHLFGGLGIGFGLLGTLILFYLSVMWLLDYGPIGTRPLFFLGFLLMVVSIQMISTGVVAEFIIRLSNPGRQTELIVAETAE